MQGKSLEDCRDYLRTGRCKYGASCKYNHPDNVQNGGGVKPLDPSEPLFPLRPNEPVCQYFMKHGTCKFGQACKFHHPPQSSVHMMDGTGQVHLVNVSGHRKPEPPPQLVLNPMGADPNGQGMMLQFLPQRPGEPECIYFLKNGRCKYGATCRYHHPIHPQARRVENKAPPAQRRVQDPYNRGGQKVQYVTQMVPSYSNQGQQVVLSSDSSPVTIINMDGSTGSNQGYQIINGSDGVTSYCVPAGSVVVTEQGSSTSSIASSYEQHEFLNGDSSNRAKRNGSNGNLTGHFIPHSASEGNIQQQQRRTRSVSYGSVSDHGSSIFETSSANGLPRNASVGSWKQATSQYSVIQEQGLPGGRSPFVANGQQQRRPMPGMRRLGPRGGQGDEGFTMMTSALLHMLDTPEEVAAEGYSDEEYRQHAAEQYAAHQGDPSMYIGQMPLEDPRAQQQVLHHHDAGENQSYVDPGMFEQLSLQDPHAVPGQRSPLSSNGESSAWSPTWQPSNNQGPPNDGFMINQSSAPEPNHDSDVGLYLP